MILCSVWITESCDGLKSSLRINKSRKQLVWKFNSSDNPSLFLSYKNIKIYIKNAVRIVIVNIIMI